MPFEAFISSVPIWRRAWCRPRLAVMRCRPSFNDSRMFTRARVAMLLKPELNEEKSDNDPSQLSKTLQSLSTLMEKISEHGNQTSEAAQDSDEDIKETASLQSFVSAFSNKLQLLLEGQKSQEEVQGGDETSNSSRTGDKSTMDERIRNIALASFLVGLAGGENKSKEDASPTTEYPGSNNCSTERDINDDTTSATNEFSVSSIFATLGDTLGKRISSGNDDTSGETEKMVRTKGDRADFKAVNQETSTGSRESLETTLKYLQTSLSLLIQRSRGDESKIGLADAEEDPIFNANTGHMKRDSQLDEKPDGGLDAGASISYFRDLISTLASLSQRTKGSKRIQGDPEKQHESEDVAASAEETVLGALVNSEARKDINPMLSSLLSSVNSQLGDATSANLESIRKGLGSASDLSEKAVLATMKALGVEPLDVEEHDPEGLPRIPLDPLLGLILAGYSFRAYDEPPSGSYRETYASIVKGSTLSGLENQIIHTEFAYPDTSIISRRADGLFFFHVHNIDGLHAGFVTADINGAVVLDLLNLKHCSVLRQRDPQGLRERTLLHRETDEVEFFLYSNRRSYEEGRTPTHTASVQLSDIVSQAMKSCERIDAEKCRIVFEKVSEDEQNQDFFRFSLLPKELKLPFQAGVEKKKVGTEHGESTGGSFELQISFIPFSREAEESLKKSGSIKALQEALSNVLRTPIDTSEDKALEEILESKLEPGQLPDTSDWTKLASLGRSIRDQIDDMEEQGRVSTLQENIPGSLFIESLATDTEVWLFHDELNKNIVISFRGTEQVSWQDFFTDSQIFLQRWTPGEDIDLNVNLTNTVGLAELVPNIFPNQESPISDPDCAVHYGFLRAYLSVRDGLLRAIDMLTNELEQGYTFHFTGHSLGGALAIITAADFEARHMFSDHDVCCMSFGAPKVGNIHFARLHNRLVPNSFRVVNDTDLVSRMPRSVASNSALSRYSHAGRTVLVNDQGEYWIEGSDDSNWEEMINSFADPLRERYNNLQDLVTFEQGLWKQLLSGRSVQNHMEDSYFVALQRVLKKVKEDEIV